VVNGDEGKNLLKFCQNVAMPGSEFAHFWEASWLFDSEGNMKRVMAGWKEREKGRQSGNRVSTLLCEAAREGKKSRH
jgi:hypothetical protein